MRTRLACCAVVCSVMATVAGPVWAQNASAKDDVHNAFNVDSMMDQAVENISRRYNLNRSQNEYTREMMYREVNRFLREHQDEIYPLIRDLTQAGFSGQNLTPDQRMRLGKAAKPLIDAAKKAILDSNAQWRNVLSEDQKGLHDWDLREMEGQFEQIHGNIDKLAAGEAVDNPFFPEPKPITPEPPRPKKPGEQSMVPAGPVVERSDASPFDVCVENFIKDYELDAAQQETARSFLREYKEYVETYRKSHKNEFDAIEKKLNEARNSGDIAKAKEAEAEQEKLNARIRQFLEEMRQRLMTIPREAQKNAYQARESAGSGAPSDKKTPDAAETGKQDGKQSAFGTKDESAAKDATAAKDEAKDESKAKDEPKAEDEKKDDKKRSGKSKSNARRGKSGNK